MCRPLTEGLSREARRSACVPDRSSSTRAISKATYVLTLRDEEAALHSLPVSEKQGVDSVAESAFRRHYAEVYRFVRRRTRSREDAEDVAQAVFENAVVRLEGFKPGASPVLAWLYTVAGRRLADEARRRRRQPSTVPLEHAAAHREARPEYGRDIDSILRTSIAALPAEQRQVVVMKLLEGRRYSEIADRLGISEEACRMRLSRALRTLRETLANEEVSP